MAYHKGLWRRGRGTYTDTEEHLSIWVGNGRSSANVDTLQVSRTG